MDTKYHEIFVVMPDVFERAGAQVFQEIQRNHPGEKNLIVIPHVFLTALEESSRYSGGSGHVLRMLREYAKQDLVPDQKNSVSICHALSGLDIALLDTGQKSFTENSTAKLEETITRLFKNIDKKRPVFIANNDSSYLLLMSKGLRVEEPGFVQVSEMIVNEGIINGNEELQAELYGMDNQMLPVETVQQMLNVSQLNLNQLIRFKGSEAEPAHYARVIGNIHRDKTGTRIIGTTEKMVQMVPPTEYEKILLIGNYKTASILGIKPRDMEQYFAMQYGLLNPDCSLFFLCGAQGSGKTLLSYICAVDQVLAYEDGMHTYRGLDKKTVGRGRYDQIILLKPNEIVGGDRRDIGALPGDLFEKLEPHIAPFIDAHKRSTLGTQVPFLDMILHPKFDTKYGPKRSEAAKSKIGGAFLPSNNEVVEVGYSGFMRGRSFANAIVIVDEAQNLTPYEMKTIITRLTESCKLIVMGDPVQLDNPENTKNVNGLTSAIKYFLGNDYVGLVNLSRNYRSQMSEDATPWNVFSKRR